ncbi:Hypothetical_protein [Hexamita inflata]|uniref:Hypothetical_protein n=1 Tax=Hexamita inflata TaxID=28002 RepID=A0AA86PZ09_9EUKA|nr:Hypothetical protein HINF_LOCUS35126 [Hexamita inflata]
MRSHCHIIYVPKNTTPQNQVLDVSVNGPFKAYLRGIHHRYCVREHNKILNMNAHVGHIPEEANIKIPPPQRRNSYFQIMETISLIDPSVVIHGFEKIQILTTSTTKTPPNLYVARGGQQILGFAEFSHQRTFWNCCVNENNIGINQILFPRDVDIAINDDEDEEDEAFVFDEEENQE